MRSCSLLPAFAAALLVSACQTEENGAPAETRVSGGDVDMADIKATISAIQDTLAQVVAQKDAATLSRFYAEDARMLPANMDMIKGREAIQRGFADYVKDMDIQSVTYTTQDVMMIGDRAREIGTYEMTFKLPDGKTVSDRGKYLMLWKRDSDGRWLITDDVSNTSLPAVQPETATK